MAVSGVDDSADGMSGMDDSADGVSVVDDFADGMSGMDDSADGMNVVDDFVDGNSVCSEADLEAYTSIGMAGDEDLTGECALMSDMSNMEGVE